MVEPDKDNKKEKKEEKDKSDNKKESGKIWKALLIGMFGMLALAIVGWLMLSTGQNGNRTSTSESGNESENRRTIINPDPAPSDTTQEPPSNDPELKRKEWIERHRVPGY